MNRKTGILLSLVVFCFAANGAAQTKSADEVVQVLKKYDEAWNKKDAAAVGKILADEYIYFSSRGGETSRQATLDFLVSPKYVIKLAERSEIKTYRTGNTVIVSSRWKGILTYEGFNMNDDQRCSLVFAKTGKQWKLLSEHCTQIATN